MQRKIKKNMLSLLLALCMAIGMLPTGVVQSAGAADPQNDLQLTARAPAVYQDVETIMDAYAVLGDEDVPISQFSEFNVTTEDTEILEITGVGDDGIKIRGKKIGKANLNIDATYQEMNVTKTVEVQVRENTYKYDYRKVAYEVYGQGFPIDMVSDFNMTAIGNRNELNPESKNCLWTDQWMWNGQGGNNANFRFADSLYGCMWDGGVGAWASFKIKVMKDGVFSATSQNGFWGNGGIFKLYLAPEGVENPRDEQYLLGEIDTYAAKPNWTVETHLRNVTLDAGNYVITYVKTGQNRLSRGNRCPIGAFMLNPIFEHEIHLRANMDSDRVMLRDTKEIPLVLELDGAEIDFSNADKLEVFSSDEAVATAKIQRSADKKTASVMIDGKKLGKTTVKANVSVNGQSAEYSMDISVVDPDVLDYVELSAEKNMIQSGETISTALRAYRINGDAIDLSQAVPYYESADASIVAVDSNGVLTGRNRGTTKITAFVEIDGALTKATLTISVESDAPITTAAIKAPPSVQIGESIDLAITGRLSSGSAYTSSNATFEIVSAEPEECAALSGAKLAGKALGSVTIRAIVEGIENQPRIETEPATIKIREKQAETGGNVSYNFRNDQKTKILDATVEKNGWALNRDMTDPKVFDSNAQHLRYQSYGIACVASESNMQLGSDITFDINIPADGVYVMSVDGGQYAAGFLASIYIDKQYVGQYDFYGTENLKVGPSVAMNAVELSSGTHQVTFRRSSDKGYLYLGSMNFRKITAMPEIQGFALSVGKNELAVGESTSFRAGMETSDGSNYMLGRLFEGNAEDPNNYMTVEISDPDVLSMDSTSITGLKEGTATITLRGAYQGTPAEKSVTVTIDRLLGTKLIATAENTTLKPSDTEGQQIKVAVLDALGNEMDMNGAAITYKNMNEAVLRVTETGVVFPVAVGKADVVVRLVKGELDLTTTITFHIRLGKTESSYYTPERVAAIRENIQLYDWARGSSDSVIENANRFLDKQDFLWETVTTQELPRGITVGYRWDPGTYNCRYCGEDLRVAYGYYPWLIDPFTEEFKIQCPECRHKFPSNDFKSFYKLGIKEDGNWSYELAKEKNAELVENGGEGYLKNILYPEMDEKLGVTNWGVDDGYGYRTGKTIVDSTGENQEETHTYIAYYNHWGIWYQQATLQNGGIVSQAINALRDAYLYTGDARYGRIGATLLDRIVDVYPDMSLKPYYPRFFNSDSTQPHGKMIGSIWQTSVTTNYILAYDVFYPMYDDAKTLSYIQSKAETIGLTEEKNSPALIRNRIEDNLLRQAFTDIKTLDIIGNFGTHQSTAAAAGVVLDTMPDTKEIIDWIFRNSTAGHSSSYNPGGNVTAQITNVVDRDGFGAESAPGYNSMWIVYPTRVADYLAGYKGYEAADLYKDEKFLKMFKAQIPLTLCRRATAQIGDYGATGGTGFAVGLDSLINGFMYSGDVELAQFIYLINGNSVEGLHANYMTPNPESVQQKIQDIIDTHGEYDLDRSQQLAGYGFSILRDGTYLPSADSAKTLDTQRDFWLYYGGANSHKHMDVLNLGIEAYGFIMAPDLGYPEAADGAEKNTVWGQGTIIHNTVMVNEERHNVLYSNNPEGTTERTNGNPLHFDDSGRVKVMDIDAPSESTKGTAADPSGIFRRSIVMVRVNDEISYGVDFFRVKGGKTHTYNFHAMSDEIYETEGLTFTKQTIGTYAGPDVPYGTLGHANGFSWLYNVRRAVQPQTGEFSIDFKIKDFRQLLKRPMDLHMRMTMLNDFDVSEVAIATGQPPQVSGNPKALEFVMVKRTDPSAQNLDTLFTTVLEPYNEERYIKSMSQVPVYRSGGDIPGALDVAKAIKVELANGNIDYIVYATNNGVQYRVDDTFEFKGFVGVYTMKDGECVYAYGNDASIIGDVTGTAAYTGKVVDFTKNLTGQNNIMVSFDQPVDVNLLKDKFINIDNNRKENGAYQILSAATVDNRVYTLDIGDCSLIDKFKDANNNDAGYVYNIAEGQTFRIALPLISDTAPVFTAVADKTVEAGSELKFSVAAESDSGVQLTYSAGEMPRGANFDPATQTFSWIPDSSQLGDAHATFHVTNGVFTDSLHVRMKVYNSASHGGDKPINNPSPGTGGGSTGGTEKPGGDDKPLVVKVEEDEVKFAASTGETTAESKLGSVTFPDGTFAEDGQGTLKIKKEKEKFNISVSATVDMEEKPAKVSLNYTPADNMTDKNCIVVKDANGNIIPNGRYADGKMTFYTDTFGDFTIVYNPKSFTDLGNHAWASEAVIRLAARGIINGITATTYGPARNITRADFTTLIVRAFGFEGEVASFADVPANAYYAQPVGIAKTLGIVGGVNESDFAPTAEITRQDMMVIVARALDKAGYVLDASDSPEFADEDEVSDYAKEAVQTLTASGIIAGANGKINPKGKTTRAEVAVILDRIVFMAK